MKTRILIAILTVGVFSISTMKAQEKPMIMEQDTLKMDHSAMEMKQDTMKIDHSTMTKTFVCPMHPEVTSDKPGKCPKCDMDMGEKKMDMKKKDAPKKHKH